MNIKLNYCNECGSKVSFKIPADDNLPRYICDNCGNIHYQNPRIIAGCIAEWDNKILLCRRAIEPRHGLWTLPAGFMENLETTVEGACREAKEEANADIVDTQLFCMFSIPHISQVYMMYRGQLKNGFASAGTESLEVGLFSEQDIPWDKIAFPVISETLKIYFSDMKQGQFNVHNGEIIKMNDSLIINHY